jgi:hypothetical protein
VNSSFRWSRVGGVAFAAAALASPTAKANHSPGAHATLSSSSALVWTASTREIDRLGPKHVPLQHRISPPPTTVVKVVRPAGFDWADASIGAGIASLTLALVAGLAMFVTRRSRRTIVPERSEPARV